MAKAYTSQNPLLKLMNMRSPMLKAIMPSCFAVSWAAMYVTQTIQTLTPRNLYTVALRGHMIVLLEIAERHVALSENLFSSIQNLCTLSIVSSTKGSTHDFQVDACSQRSAIIVP